ncbi:unnamed protein product [Cylicostephanus goldi]|uniref:Peptidase M13 C-terminal domain-containing protein n=1 Tax=Cylicostephanus goldi TaxID=71465 RepID=A0A3P7N7M1_CYLGO|nr:unnamed protein product [Cylicostephanus goldi]
MSLASTALNYGGIGAIVGHEITHGFDNEGRLYDAFGERNEWWNEEVKKEYVQRAQCFIDQYGKIEVAELTGEFVNQVLANQPEFAAAFKCDVDSPMNPIERCHLW